MSIEKFLSKKDISKTLGINICTLDRWIAAGDFPAPDLRKFGAGKRGKSFVRWKESTLARAIEEMAQAEERA